MVSAAELRTALVRYQNARPSLKDAMYASALALSTRLASERDEVMKRLDKRWDWCWTNVDNSKFAEREAALLDDLKTYEAIEDALNEANAVLLGAVA